MTKTNETETRTADEMSIAAKARRTADELDQAARDAALALAKAIAAVVAHNATWAKPEEHVLALAVTLREAPEMAKLILDAGYFYYEDSQIFDEDKDEDA